MDSHYLSSELGRLIDELADRVLREHGLGLATDLERQLRPLEDLVYDLEVSQELDVHAIRDVRRAVNELRGLLRCLPAALERAINRDEYDRLRALRVDVELQLL